MIVIYSGGGSGYQHRSRERFLVRNLAGKRRRFAVTQEAAMPRIADRALNRMREYYAKYPED